MGSARRQLDWRRLGAAGAAGAASNYGATVGCDGARCSKKLVAGQPAFVITLPSGDAYVRSGKKGEYLGGIPAAVLACSKACAENLKERCQPSGSAHFRVHNRGGAALLLTPSVAKDAAAAAWLRKWLQGQGLQAQP